MATIGELIQKYGVEYIGRYYSNYRGVVIDNVDPNQMGRIFVMLPGIHDGIRTWARPKAMPGGLKYGLKWITPRIGEVVWVEFENGDPLKAIWNYYGWTMGDIPDELQDGNTVGFITPSGNKVYLQDIDGKLKVSINTEIGIEIPEGVNLVMDKDKLQVTQGDSNLTITKNGFTVNKGGSGLKKTLDDLLTAIQKLTVTTNVGPSGVPINLSEFQQIQQDLSNYLEE